MKKVFLFILMTFFLLGCDKGNDHHNYTENLDYWNTMNRIDFKNYDSFIPTYKRIYNMKNADYKAWCDSLSNFESYAHFWIAINNEYDQLKTEDEYLNFKETYKDYVKFSNEKIEGLPDYSFEPNIRNTSLMRLVNKEGFISINNKIYDTKKEDVIPGLKSYIKDITK